MATRSDVRPVPARTGRKARGSEAAVSRDAQVGTESCQATHDRALEPPMTGSTARSSRRETVPCARADVRAVEHALVCLSARSSSRASRPRRPGREGFAREGQGFGTISTLPSPFARSSGRARAPRSVSSQKPSLCGRKCELIEGRAGGTVTFHGSSSRTTRLRDRSHAPSRRKTPVPVTSPRTPGRLGHGHSLPGPWSRRPRPFPFGRQLKVAASPTLRCGEIDRYAGWARRRYW
jgi:hypothetical protein